MSCGRQKLLKLYDALELAEHSHDLVKLLLHLVRRLLRRTRVGLGLHHTERKHPGVLRLPAHQIWSKLLLGLGGALLLLRGRRERA